MSPQVIATASAPTTPEASRSLVDLVVDLLAAPAPTAAAPVLVRVDGIVPTNFCFCFANVTQN